MTMQIKESFYHSDSKHTIVSCSAPLEFHPAKYGLKPVPYTTACHKGYWCNYALQGKQFILRDLFIHTDNDMYPPIFNCVAVFDQDFPHTHSRHRVYKDLCYPTNYTGKILIGTKEVPTYYIDGIWGIPWSYKELKELVFDQGVLIAEIDHSETAKDIRKFIRTMAKSKPVSGLMGPYVEFDYALLGMISDYPWWIECY